MTASATKRNEIKAGVRKLMTGFDLNDGHVVECWGWRNESNWNLCYRMDRLLSTKAKCKNRRCKSLEKAQFRLSQEPKIYD